MVNDHILRTYDEELTNLQILTTKMGNECCDMIRQAVASVIDNDKAIAQQVIKRDKMVNAVNAEIAIQSQNVIALRSPMANDLRKVLSAIQVGLNIERVGDLAKNMAKLALSHELFIEEKYAVELRKMGKMASSNLFASLKTYNQENPEEALAIHASDAQLDDLHKKFSKSVMLNITKDMDNIDSSVHLLFVSRHLERVGDHAKNIAEATIYKVNGEIYEPSD